ncbi:MAG: hypothetical protein DDT42_00469 [candidate division WS2 bacterium]|uniref:DUF1292 domain-containing protein n=1 Tax=Psychracetigena formicireducens TaxID=2986056 RepID=A0A9E2F1D7_PSYF1|nr:hypothetical protein [Candidatus Psychracetigena formicireducens]MBT9144627.1 hypothetical protein [Candidatus Psychracetigena formicireducens]
MTEVEELVISFNDDGKQRKYYLTELLVFNNCEYAVFFSLENDLAEPIFLKVQGDMLIDIIDEREFNRLKSYWDKLEDIIEEEKEIKDDAIN